MTQFKEKWELKRGIKLNGVFCNDEQIVVCHGQDSLKNALLIRKAPEMLEMLESLCLLYDQERITGKFPELEIKQLIKEATEL